MNSFGYDWAGLILIVLGSGGLLSIILYFLNKPNADKITKATVDKSEAEVKQIEQDVEAQYIKQLEQWLIDLNAIKTKHENELLLKDVEIVNLHKQHLEILKELEEHKYQNNRIYRAIHKVLIGIEIPYWECDSAGNLIYANGAWLTLFGLTFDQAKGYGWRTAIPVDELPELLLNWNAAVVDQTEDDLNFNILNPISSYKTKVKAVFAVVHTTDGKTEKIIGVTVPV